MNNTKNRPIAFLAVILGFFMALLDTTIVNVTLPKMTEHFNTTMNHISWVVNGYNLAFAVLIITASSLADRFGRKKLFIFGVFIFTTSSLLAGLSNSIEMLIFFRVLQGLSAAFVVPVTVPLAVDIFPPEKRGLIMGLWGAFAGLAAACGPALGGILTEYFSWRYIFFINVPIGIICVLLTLKFIKESYDPTAPKSIDFAGILTISSAMFCLTLALIKANDKGWSSTFILSLFAISAVSFILFVVIEFKTKEPMLPLNLFKIVPFTNGAISLFLLGLGMMSSAYFLSFFLTQVKELDQLTVGLIISTMSIGSIISSMLSTMLVKKISGRWLSALGMCLLSLGCFSYSFLTQNSSNSDIIIRLLLSGLGMGLCMSTLMNSMIKNVPIDKIGITSGINNMTRTLGTVLGVALFLTIFTSNIDTEMSHAKDNAIKIVQADTVFDAKAKDGMVSSLKSSESKSTNLSDVLKKIDASEELALKTDPPIMQDRIKQSFATQKTETKKIWPIIQEKFKTHTVNSFSFTFKCSSLILLPGIFFALFSDKIKPRINKKNA